MFCRRRWLPRRNQENNLQVSSFDCSSKHSFVRRIAVGPPVSPPRVALPISPRSRKMAHSPGKSPAKPQLVSPKDRMQKMIDGTLGEGPPMAGVKTFPYRGFEVRA